MVGFQNTKKPASIWREWVGYQQTDSVKELLPFGSSFMNPHACGKVSDILQTKNLLLATDWKGELELHLLSGSSSVPTGQRSDVDMTGHYPAVQKVERGASASR